jgi:3-dehydroquinate dehydratase-2
MRADVLLLHGVNLGVLGTRQPEIYGSLRLEDIERGCFDIAGELGLRLETFQSDVESELVHKLHRAKDEVRGVVFNAGAFTHYSWAIADAVSYFGGDVIEVHLSNTMARETWRHQSVLSPVCRGVIQGLGMHGYELAVRALFRLWSEGA